MAVVDLNSGNIYGAKPGSLTYLHELGHIEFNKKDWGVKINYYGQFFMMIAVFFLGLNLFYNNPFLKVFTFLNCLGIVVCYIIEEGWCWGYALKNRPHLTK